MAEQIGNGTATMVKTAEPAGVASPEAAGIAPSAAMSAGVASSAPSSAGAASPEAAGIAPSAGEASSAALSAGAGASGGSASGKAIGAATKPIPFAAVSFVCGLVGLLVANLLLGPLAVILGAIGLRADANRRMRAVLGILLGVADIAVFLFLAAHAGAHHGSLSWNFLGR